MAQVLKSKRSAIWNRNPDGHPIPHLSELILGEHLPPLDLWWGCLLLCETVGHCHPAAFQEFSPRNHTYLFFIKFFVLSFVSY